MYQIKGIYEGISPMMMDRFYDPETTITDIKKPKGQELKKTELKLHRDKTGVYVPSDNIRMMLIGNKLRPGAAKILGSYIEKNKATNYLNMCKSFIFVQGPENPLKVYIKPKRKTFDEVDERTFITAGNPPSRKITRRPLIMLPWSLSFIIQVIDDSIDESFVKKLFEVAGLRCGCCAYGPTFGRCIIKEWDVINKKKELKQN